MKKSNGFQCYFFFFFHFHLPSLSVSSGMSNRWNWKTDRIFYEGNTDENNKVLTLLLKHIFFCVRSGNPSVVSFYADAFSSKWGKHLHFTCCRIGISFLCNFHTGKKRKNDAKN